MRRPSSATIETIIAVIIGIALLVYGFVDNPDGPLGVISAGP